ncbi:hypothetical protein GCM10027344_27070 [Spelaeicoccus albus]|uniref:Uncharacterized protein n=1 Tax=Spelaeicoccus albus TaxID=1280376 RepID=A0A7Z0IH51_9MICO|nr:hypothetical protein [Spelaeicoccus albus]
MILAVDRRTRPRVIKRITGYLCSLGAILGYLGLITYLIATLPMTTCGPSVGYVSVMPPPAD